MTLALEINDVGLVLVRDGEIVAEEPGLRDARRPHGGDRQRRRCGARA